MTEFEGLLRLGLAVLLGGAIGFERETLNKPAGLRTHMLVTLGAAMFMVSSILLVTEFNPDGEPGRGDVTRIASTIVTGIGFLGGGIIFRTEDRVRGLTTAAGLWVASAIGLAVGAGFYITAVGATIMTLLVLVVIRRVELYTEMKEAAATRQLRGSDDVGS
jgi:putative Mg2+ transporter-C (MgtC) family protein